MAIYLFAGEGFARASDDKFELQIPMLGAPEALSRLADETGYSLFYPTEDLKSVKANALHGVYTLVEALDILLKGTSLNAVVTEKSVIIVSVTPKSQQPIEEITIDRGSDMKKASNTKSIFTGLAAFLTAMTATVPAGAQQESGFNRFALEEIIVTAQKREENLQEIPLSVSALDPARLKRSGINSPERLGFVVPNFTFSQPGSSPQFSLRGVSTTGIEINSDPVVAVFADGVYQSRSALAMAGFVDMERVEVVRGPQGTLYGRNTTGGSINLISKRPSTDGLEYGIQGFAGDFSHYGGRGFVNFPVSDKVAVRFAGLVEDRDGWAENLNISGDTNNDEDQVYVRGSVLAELSEQAELVFRASYWAQDGQGSGFNAYKVRGSQTVFDGAFNFNNDFAGFGAGGVDPGGNPSDPYDYSDNLPGSRDIEQAQISMDFTYDFDSIRFKSITAFNVFDRGMFRDADFLELDIFDVDLNDHVETFSQELQLSGELERFSWVAGLYYLQDDVDEHIIFGWRGENLFGIPAGTPFIDRTGSIDTRSFAIFAQTNVAATDRLNFTMGGRWTHDQREFEVDTPTAAVFRSGDEEYSELTWRFAADYTITDNRLLFLSVTKGFKSGGINFANVPNFDNEIVIAYEAGVKQSFNGGFANLSVFYNDFDDLQVTSFDPTLNSSFVRNAAAATIWGAELEAEFSPDEFWVITGSLAYLNATYDEFTADNPITPVGGDLVDLSGHHLPRSPEFTANIAVSRDFRIGGQFTLTPLVQFSYSSKYYQTEFNQVLDRQDDYTKTDVRLFLEHTSGWSAEAFATNLEDEAVLIAGVYGPGIPGATMFANYGAPRTFGVRIGYNY